MKLRNVLAAYKRIAITGAPGTGKTSYSNQVSDRPVIHTDDWMQEPWPEVPFLVKAACESAGEMFVVEGVNVPRTLRKGLEVDAVIYLDKPLEAQTKAQVALGKGLTTTLTEWAATHPNVPILTGITLDSRDMKRRYLTFTVDGTSYEPTPHGGRRYRAKASKAGVFRYNRGGQIVREYRPAEEIQKALPTLKSAPVVLLHPKENGGEVDVENMRRLRVGVFEDPEWTEDESAAVGSLVVDDAAALATIDGWIQTYGGVDISCGYDNERIPEPGVSPDGEEYDLVQTDYIFNHVAIGPRGWGRQGADVGLTLDADDNEEGPLMSQKNSEAKPTTKTADSADMEPKPVTTTDTDMPVQGGDATLTPEDIAGVKMLVKLLPALNQMLNSGAAPTAAPATLDSPPQQAAAPVAAPAPIQEQEKKTLDANDIERIAQEGAEVRADAQRLLGGTYSFKGKSTRQVRTDVIKTFDSAFDDKDLSEVEVLASYRMASKALEQKAELNRQLSETRSVDFGLGLTQDSKESTVKPIGYDIYTA